MSPAVITTTTSPTTTTPLPKTYKAAVAESPNAPLALRFLPTRQPAPNEVLVKVLACGVCGTDLMLLHGLLGTSPFPRVSGHEMVGDVVALGTDVASSNRFSIGDRVGGAWHGGHDGTCRACSRAQFQMCGRRAVNGVSHDGGFAEYVILRAEAVVRVPAAMDPAAAAPLLCAGVTVFNGMRKLHVEQGNLVAVQGVGGLGHLAIQYANRMGYRVVALSRGGEKRDFSMRMGAHAYIDTAKHDPAEALQEMGGAAMICATAPNAKAVTPLVGGLQPGGKLLVLAPMGPVEFDTTTLINQGASVHGWPTGHALDAEEAIQFANDHGIECVVQRFSLDDVNDAVAAIEDGSVRYRAVLCMQ